MSVKKKHVFIKRERENISIIHCFVTFLFALFSTFKKLTSYIL